MSIMEYSPCTQLLERGGWELLDLPSVAAEDRDIPKTAPWLGDLLSEYYLTEQEVGYYRRRLCIRDANETASFPAIVASQINLKSDTSARYAKSNFGYSTAAPREIVQRFERGTRRRSD